MECRTVLLTGATSGIGLALAGRFLDENYKVLGIGRNFEQMPDSIRAAKQRGAFVPMPLDMLQTGRFYEQMRLLNKRENIGCLVNCAGTAYYGLHETLNPAKIHEMVTVNLEVPMVLCQIFMRNLKKNHGHIIQISSVTAKQASPRGCAYGATKAGLTAFSESLFEEARKYGVKVTAIHPEMTKTNLYRHADFCESAREDAYLLPEQVAAAVMYALSAPAAMDVADVTLVPQRREIRRKTVQQR